MSEEQAQSTQRPHLPSAGRRVPTTTYRLQLGPDLGFRDVIGHLDYLQNLGVTDLYCSPILQAAPGSTHGYDVVDHSRVSDVMGGREAFEDMARAAHDRGMGVIVDVVPNHMAFPIPLYANKALWSVLKDGPASPYADWFDGIESEEGMLMPVLGARVGTVLANDEIELKYQVIPGFEDEGEQPVLEYFDRVFPVRAGTETLPIHLCVQEQFYRLAYWKVADEELNYRRFFDVDTLAAVRVEDPDVFEATHRVLLELQADGHIDGFRIDHPDGLADPRGYLRDLSKATGGAWVAVEKILEGNEQLPADWPVAGTTGYDASWRIGAMQIESAGAISLGAVQHEVTQDPPSSIDSVIEASKREVIATSLSAEVYRLASLARDIVQDDIYLRDHTSRWLRRCLIELIVAFDRYRAYIFPGEEASEEALDAIATAAEIARERLDPDLHDTLEVVVDLVSGREVGSAGRRQQAIRAELVTRFQQVCGAVQAKGVEDTAYYRWTALVSMNEVGGSQEAWSYGLDQFHSWMSRMAETWPATMTAGTTHDTKRGEDVRSRIDVISQYADQWRKLVLKLHPLAEGIDRHTENLMWQTIAGTWTDDGAISAERLTAYLLKASREMKLWTNWTSGDTAAEEAMQAKAAELLGTPDVLDAFADWYVLTGEASRAAILARKAVQLTCLGVADVYQGTEIVQTHLVDPDNRRPVDFSALAWMLGEVDTREPRGLSEEKLFITSRILRLRAAHPEVFVGTGAEYRPLAASTGHLLAFARGAEPRVVTLASRLIGSLEGLGGFDDHTVALPDGDWRCILTGIETPGGLVRIADLVDRYPVAVLERID